MAEENIYSRKALELIENGDSLFITGKAGTGKTTLLREFLIPKFKEQYKEYAIVAPTGVAADNAGGVTIHSYLRMPISPYIPGMKIDDLYSLNNEEQMIVRRIKVLVVDEVSMVRCDVMDAMDDILRHYRHNDKPFGGLQVLLFGDLFQLMPVAEEDEWAKLRDVGKYKTPYFFSSKVMEKGMFKMLELKKVYRQTNDMFVRILNQIRVNNITDGILETLNRRYEENFNLDNHPDYIKLTALNKTADGYNWAMLNKLPGTIREIKGRTEGIYPRREWPTDLYLKLKVGAHVMIIRNDNNARQYFNGTMGVILDIAPDYISIRVNGKTESEEGPIIHVNQERWDFYKYEINKATKKIERVLMGSFYQFPLKLSWAITIHKSQGLSFNNVVIDVGRAFAAGQVYVALSRCRRFYRMVLASKVTKRLIKVDANVMEFMARTEKVEMDDYKYTQEEKKERLVDLIRQETFWMAREGLTVEEMHKNSGNRIEIIYKDLTELIHAGKLCAEDLLDKGVYEKIVSTIHRYGEELQTVKRRCPANVKYGEINMCIADIYRKAHEQNEKKAETVITVKQMQKNKADKKTAPIHFDKCEPQKTDEPNRISPKTYVPSITIKSDTLHTLLDSDTPVYRKPLISEKTAENFVVNPNAYKMTYLEKCPLILKAFKSVVFNVVGDLQYEACIQKVSFEKLRGKNGTYWTILFCLNKIQPIR